MVEPIVKDVVTIRVYEEDILTGQVLSERHYSVMRLEVRILGLPVVLERSESTER